MTHLIEQYWCDDGIFPHREFLALTIRGKFNAKDGLNEYSKPCLLPADVSLRGIGMAYTEITAFKKGVVRLDEHWWWFALSNSDMTIHPGQQVRVIGLQGYTLLVESISCKN